MNQHNAAATRPSLPAAGNTADASWHARLAALHHSWRSVPAAPSDDQLVTAWQANLATMKESMERLRRQHQWTRGPTDLLSICGLQRRETAHSAALAWLCDPEAGHGLGTAFLAALVALTGDPVDLDDPIRIATEVARDRSRADLVARSSKWTLVVETKVDADESVHQCQRLFEDWNGEPGLRMLLLTRTGRIPRTTTTTAASQVWRSTSWRHIANVLSTVIAGGAPDAPGAVAAGQYAQTLHRLFGRNGQ